MLLAWGEMQKQASLLFSHCRLRNYRQRTASSLDPPRFSRLAPFPGFRVSTHFLTGLLHSAACCFSPSSASSKNTNPALAFPGLTSSVIKQMLSSLSSWHHGASAYFKYVGNKFSIWIKCELRMECLEESRRIVRTFCSRELEFIFLLDEQNTAMRRQEHPSCPDSSELRLQLSKAE